MPILFLLLGLEGFLFLPLSPLPVKKKKSSGCVWTRKVYEKTAVNETFRGSGD